LSERPLRAPLASNTSITFQLCPFLSPPTASHKRGGLSCSNPTARAVSPYHTLQGKVPLDFPLISFPLIHSA
jgi:hypothetical protein